ncbi:lysophospholipase [Thalassospira sp. HJ]|uniref:OmpA family protein n=1 Tax=Thalassospira sp. HJ TaxID=1616823 RepID=UPI0005DFC80A|nr:OmpA family protein [Thalassospira sp. HJ]KJE35139.1 lysophospholipase [Thalassospira sp. HJ]
MMGYSKISVLAMTAALGTTVFFGANASAQQYSPVSNDSSVQVNWDVADGYGGQPTVPQYLSPSVSREHIVMPGGDLIFPETRPKSTFLAAEQFASATGSAGYDGGFETVVIDGSSGGGNAFPTQSEFYGVPGVATASRTPAPAPVSAPAMMDDGANQTIALNQPEPTAAPRSKPAAPAVSETSSSNAPTPLTKPAPAPAAPAPSVAEAAPAAEPAPVEENTAPSAPAAPKVAPISEAPAAPAAPAPDTTQSAPQMAATAEPVTEQVAREAPAAEEAAIPPETSAPAPMPATGADEYSLGFAADSFELSAAAKSQLDSVIASMGQDENLRIQLQAYAQGDGANASKARRLSLSRALQVRSYLIDRGVRSTRIDVRALGANVPSGPADRVDIKTVQR